MKRRLVIKLSALGDLVLATGAFQAIRAYHGDDHLVLLTTSTYEDFARASGYFDEVWIDSRPPLWRFWSWLALGVRLRGGGFERLTVELPGPPPEVTMNRRVARSRPLDHSVSIRARLAASA